MIIVRTIFHIRQGGIRQIVEGMKQATATVLGGRKCTGSREQLPPVPGCGRDMLPSGRGHCP